MDITVFNYDGVLNTEYLTDMLLPLDVTVGTGAGFGTLPAYHADTTPVAVTSYGKVIRFAHRRITVSTGHVNTLYQQYLRQRKAADGTIPLSEEAKRIKQEIRERLVAQTLPTTTDIYAVELFGYIAICTSNTQHIAMVIQALQLCDLDIGHKVQIDYETLHTKAQGSGVGDYTIGDELSMSNAQGMMITVKNAATHPIESLITSGFEVTSVKLVGMLASFVMTIAGAKQVAMSKAARAELLEEWREAPEILEVLEAAATVCTMLDEYCQFCRRVNNE